MNRREGSRPRYQVRLQFDERSGEVWSWLQSVPDRARPGEIHFLIQLGLRVSEGIRQGTLGAMQLDDGIEPGRSGRHVRQSPSMESVDELDAFRDWALDPGFDALMASPGQGRA